MAVIPMMAPQSLAYQTDAQPDAAHGVFEIVERPDLRPHVPLQFEYTSPAIPNASRQLTLEGALPRLWHLYVPPSASGSDGPRPVVILFHGAGRDSLSMIDMWQAEADARGIVLIGMNARSDGWQADAVNGALYQDVLNQAASIHPIDRERVFLFGHSAGSVMAQVVANRAIGPWRGVAVHAGSVLSPDLLHPIENAPPVRHYLGTVDNIFDVASARQAGQMAATVGHDHTLVLISQHGHWFYEIGPTIAAEAWAWFETL